jgi:hypothetical protein
MTHQKQFILSDNLFDSSVTHSKGKVFVDELYATNNQRTSKDIHNNPIITDLEEDTEMINQSLVYAHNLFAPTPPIMKEHGDGMY